MKTTLIFILLICNWQTCTAQFFGLDVSDNFNGKDLRKNRVKEISVFMTIDTTGKYSMGIIKNLISRITFDSLGNKLHEINFDSSGKIMSETFYEYDNYSNITLAKFIYLNSKEEKIEESTFYSYVDGKLIKEWRSDSLNFIEFIYNKLGQKEKTIQTNKSNKVTVRIYKYDELGNEIESFVDGKEFGLNYKRIYDNKNNKIEETIIYHLDTINSIFSKFKYFYNDNGFLVKEEFIDGYAKSPNVNYIYDNMNNLIIKQTGESKIFFFYDNIGNRIKKISNPLGLFVTLVEYEYKYF